VKKARDFVLKENWLPGFGGGVCESCFGMSKESANVKVAPLRETICRQPGIPILSVAAMTWEIEHERTSFECIFSHFIIIMCSSWCPPTYKPRELIYQRRAVWKI